MASISAFADARMLIRLTGVLGLVATAYTARSLARLDWKAWATHFFTGPGRTSRILLALFVLANTKSMPLAWTVRAPVHLRAKRGRGVWGACPP